MFFSIHVVGNGGQLHKSALYLYTFPYIGEDYQTEPVRVNTASIAPFFLKIDLDTWLTVDGSRLQNYCIFCIGLSRKL